MLQQSTIDFLKKLEKNNNKPWFDKNRAMYEEAKADFEVFIAGLLQKLTPLEPAFADLKAKDCIFRIYRDVRFSKDKTPYKAHFSAAFGIKGKKDAGGGFYLHLKPGEAFAGGGMWMPQGEMLKAIRQEIDYNFDEFKKIINGAAFKKTFGKLSEEDKLKKMPQGYDETNPAADYLKLKSFVASGKIDDKELTGKTLTNTIVKTFSTLKPLVDFLNRSQD